MNIDTMNLPVEEWSFVILYYPSKEGTFAHSGYQSVPHICDFELFVTISKTLGRYATQHRPDQPYHAVCHQPVDSPPLRRVLELLASAGWYPVFSCRQANEQNPGEFKVLRHVPPATSLELDTAPFLCKDLCLQGGWGTHLERDILHAKWEDDLADPAAAVVDVRGDVRDYPTAWTPEAQHALLKAGMMGGDFAPIVWHCDDLKVLKYTHYLRSSIRFPPTLTPRCVGPLLVDENYLATHGEPEVFEWDDEGRIQGQARMFYHRNDLESMQGVDIARTHESFPTGGESRRCMPAKMIFSQRFRRWADASGLRFTWQPVVVVD